MKTNNVNNKNYEVILNEARISLLEQYQIVRAIDTKAGVTFGLLVVAVSLALTTIHKVSVIILGLGLFLIIVALVLILFSFFPKPYKRGLKPEILVDQMRNMDLQEIYKKLMAAYRDSYNYNEKIIKRKSTFFKYSLILTFLGLVIIIIAHFIKVVR